MKSGYLHPSNELCLPLRRRSPRPKLRDDETDSRRTRRQCGSHRDWPCQNLRDNPENSGRACHQQQPPRMLAFSAKVHTLLSPCHKRQSR